MVFGLVMEFEISCLGTHEWQGLKHVMQNLDF